VAPPNSRPYSGLWLPTLLLLVGGSQTKVTKGSSRGRVTYPRCVSAGQRFPKSGPGQYRKSHQNDGVRSVLYSKDFTEDIKRSSLSSSSSYLPATATAKVFINWFCKLPRIVGRLAAFRSRDHLTRRHSRWHRMFWSLKRHWSSNTTPGSLLCISIVVGCLERLRRTRSCL
jgi:hypothetical protein